MSNKQTVPLVDIQTIRAAATGTSAFTYDLKGIDRASLQLNSTFGTPGSTDAITLKISNDGVNFVGFATAKTVTLTGGTTDSALFELGAIDYVFLQVSMAAPSAGTLAMQGVLYGVATGVQIL